MQERVQEKFEQGILLTWASENIQEFVTSVCYLYQFLTLTPDK